MERKDFMWELEHPFPYGDADFVRDYKDLLSALGTGDEGRVVSIRKALKERLSREDWEYMTWQEWKEGTARCRPIANGAPLDSSCYNTKIGDEDAISCSSFREFRMKRSRANATDDPRRRIMEKTKRIALVAHDNRKRDMREWVEYNYGTLVCHKLVSTGTTGRLVEEVIKEKFAQDHVSQEPPELVKLKSGPLGGDQQLGGMIVDGKIDCIIFFWDPMEPFPHDVDVKALLRIAVLYNIPIACNRSTADFLISSPLMNEAYEPVTKDYTDYINRRIP